MTSADPLQGVLTLTGYGLRLGVERGHLVVEDGVGDERRAGRFSRVDQSLKRVIVIGHSGSITLDAIAWLHGVGVPLIHLDYDGQVYLVSSPAAPGIAQLRRAQAGALDTPRGVAIARALLSAKIEGQLTVLDELPEGDQARPILTDSLDAVREAAVLKTVRDQEAKAARAYWRAWRRVSVQFDRRGATRRPSHWLAFGPRRSPLAGESPRKAVNPANAVLNYLYAILEAEATVAALGTRLEPTLGLLHADREHRPSLSCDLMEPIRPVVDRFALSLFRERSFSVDDAFEQRDGHCRLLPPFTRELATTAALWAHHVYPVAVEVAKALIDKRRKGANIVPGTPMPRLGAKRQPRGYTSRVRQFQDVAYPTWSDVYEMAQEGKQATRKVFAANRAWDRTHGTADVETYRRDIQPELRDIPLKQLVGATGLSKTSCAAIRRGRKVPHARHWGALRQLIQEIDTAIS